MHAKETEEITFAEGKEEWLGKSKETDEVVKRVWEPGGKR